MAITLADFEVPAEFQAIVLSLWEATAVGIVLSDDLVAGDAVVSDSLTIARVERPISGTTIRLRKTDDGVFSFYFGFNTPNPLFPEARLYIQLEGQDPIQYVVGSTGTGFNNWTNDDPAVVATLLGIAAGTQFILAIVIPAVADPGRVRSAMVSGIPVFSATVRSQRRIRVRAAIKSGVPELAAQIRVERRIQVRAAMASGVPVFAAQIRTELNPRRVRAAMVSGVPFMQARVRVVSTLVPPTVPTTPPPPLVRIPHLSVPLRLGRGDRFEVNEQENHRGNISVCRSHLENSC